MTNIDEFEYAAEYCKQEFQANIGSLLELQALLSTRLAEAQERDKTGVFFTAGEIEIFGNWILQSASSILENYAIIDRTNRLTNKLYRAGIKVHEHSATVQLNKLVPCL